MTPLVLARRIPLGIAAALWAVLVPGQAGLLMQRSLCWPRWRPARGRLPRPSRRTAGSAPRNAWL